MKTLVPLSGGYDSTAALYRLLTETDDAIYVYHLSWQLGSITNVADTAATRKILPWLYRNTRVFQFHSSELKSSLGCRHAPLVYVGLFTAMLALSKAEHFDRVVIGSIGPQDARSHANNKIAETLCETMLDEWMQPPLWDYPFQFEGNTKARMMASMPEELRAMCWTCKMPVSLPDGMLKPCGQCAKCVELDQSLVEMNNA